MNQKNPTFGREFDRNEISEVLGIRPEDIEERFPIQEVSAGLPFIRVPLVSLDAVKRCHVNRDRYFSLVEKIDAKAILVFAPETYKRENDLNARVFVDYFGIPEDPAIGSGNGCLAGYLVKHRRFDRDEIDIKVEQGCEIGRPSLLSLGAKADGEAIDVNVGGRVVMIAGGRLE